MDRTAATTTTTTIAASSYFLCFLPIFWYKSHTYSTYERWLRYYYFFFFFSFFCLLSQKDPDDNSKGIRHSKLRNELRTVRFPKLRPNESLHRSLSWHLICPSHERGYTGGRFNANLRNRIDEILEDQQSELEQAYVPDVACYHLKERVIFEKRTTLQKQDLSSWKGKTKNIIELPFYFFDFV